MEQFQAEAMPDDFDWMETLASAGVSRPMRDLSHMASEDVVALIMAEQEAAIALARSIGLPQEADIFGRPIAVDWSAEDQADMLASVNAVTVAAADLAQIMEIVDVIPAPMKVAGRAPANTVLEHARDHDVDDPAARRALLARAVALSRWQLGAAAADAPGSKVVIDAAARAPVVLVDGLPAFDRPAFDDLVAFIADLPF